MLHAPGIDKSLEKEIQENAERFHISIPSAYEDFICPISLQLMVNPVMTNCKHLFEEESLRVWQEQKHQSHHDDCPQCRQPIRHSERDREHKQKIQHALKVMSTYLKELKPQRYQPEKLLPDCKIEPQRIYLRAEEENIVYCVRNPFNPFPPIIQGTLSKNEMDIVLGSTAINAEAIIRMLLADDFEHIQLYLSHILAVTSSKGHTLCPQFDGIRQALIADIDRFIMEGNDVEFLKTNIIRNIKSGNIIRASKQSFEVSRRNMCAML